MQNFLENLKPEETWQGYAATQCSASGRHDSYSAQSLSQALFEDNYFELHMKTLFSK